MAFGGPQLMAQAVGNLVGIHPDYVFAAGFFGFRHMIRAIGGVTVYSKFAFSDPVRPQGYHHGKNRLTPFQALIFARVRHALPRGDFDRSHDQQSLMKGILREVRRKQDQPGFMERGVLSVFKNMNTDLRPSELYTLAQAATRIQPRKYRGCVINGSTGYVGAMSVVYPDVGEARNIARRVRRDATLEGPC
jgi:anionic cell wall polymer biosynthesis LytR-Cps2A-Psr (LCP) family protein